MNKKKINIPKLKLFGKLLVILLLGNVIFLSIDFKSTNSIIDFRIRGLLGENPKLDPRIKVFAKDDKTVAFNKHPNLTIEQWAHILETLDERKPSRIIIPGLFTLVESKSEHSKDEAIRKISSLKTPITTMSFTSPTAILHRHKASLTHDRYKASSITHLPPEEAAKALNSTISLNHTYGPEKSLDPLFDLGHFQFNDASQHAPYIFLREGKILPHIMLKASKDARITEDGLFINSKKVDLTNNGKILVNYSRSFDKTSLLNILKKGKKSAAVKNIKEGDTIVIILSYYTGSTKFVMTPLGFVPSITTGNHILNSVLTGQWIQPISWTNTWMWISLNILISFLVAQLLPPKWVAISTSMTVVLQVAMGIITFAYFSTQWDWLATASIFFLTSVATILTRLINIETNSRKMKRALTGLLPPSQVAAALKDPSSLNLKPQEREVTLIFIDIVGFSLTSKKVSTEEIFSEVRDFLQEITDQILLWGGLVDKTLGDGMLCFFGFDINKEDYSLNHGMMAVRCALAIQDLCYQRNLDAQKESRPILPLRIGINTARVIIGNLGGAQRIDITMMGEGVNFASRLETSCDPFKIMVGATTYERIKYEELDVSVTKRLIQIKHFDAMIDAYEINPFFRNPRKLKELKDLYWKWLNDGASEARYSISPEKEVYIMIQDKPFEVLNFSLSGFLIKGPRYYARGVTCNAWLRDKYSAINQSLTDPSIMPFLIEIRSGQESDDGNFIMGIHMPGLNELQKQSIFRACLKLAEKEKAS